MENIHARTDDDGNTEPGHRVREIIENHQSEYGRADNFDVLKGCEYADGGKPVGIGYQQVTNSRYQAQGPEQ